jgi:hypothetical protein
MGTSKSQKARRPVGSRPGNVDLDGFESEAESALVVLKAREFDGVWFEMLQGSLEPLYEFTVPGKTDVKRVSKAKTLGEKTDEMQSAIEGALTLLKDRRPKSKEWNASLQTSRETLNYLIGVALGQRLP